MCGWLARAYGLQDAAYYEAYNNELHRQALLCWITSIGITGILIEEFLFPWRTQSKYQLVISEPRCLKTKEAFESFTSRLICPPFYNTLSQFAKTLSLTTVVENFIHIFPGKECAIPTSHKWPISGNKDYLTTFYWSDLLIRVGYWVRSWVKKGWKDEFRCSVLGWRGGVWRKLKIIQGQFIGQ